MRARGHFPTDQAALKCFYLVTRSLDPTGRGRARWVMRWKPALNGDGAFLGFEAAAGPYAREVAFVYRLVDGRIAERWAVRDDLTMLRQLGALHPA